MRHRLHGTTTTSVSDERSERARGCGRDLSDTSSAFVFHRASGCDGMTVFCDALPQVEGLNLAIGDCMHLRLHVSLREVPLHSARGCRAKGCRAQRPRPQPAPGG